MIALQREFFEMKDRLDHLEEEKHAWQNERAILQQRIADQRRSPLLPLADPPVVTPRYPHYATPAPTEEVEAKRTKTILPKPEKFHGSRDAYPVWKANMEARIKVDGAAMLLTERTVSLYMSSFCDGEAGTYLLPYGQQIASGSMGYDQFWQVMDLRYKDLHRQKRAAIEFNSLKQGSRSFVEFLADFERLSSEACYDAYPDPVKIERLEGKLSAELRQLAITGMTDDDLRAYNPFVQKLHTLDSRLRAAKLDGAFKYQLVGGRPKSEKGLGRAPSPKMIATENDTMDWTPSTNRLRGAKTDNRPQLPLAMQNISEKETQARKERNACFTCGNTGHTSRNCGYAPPKNRVNAHVAQVSLPVPVWCDASGKETGEQESQGKE